MPCKPGTVNDAERETSRRRPPAERSRGFRAGRRRHCRATVAACLPDRSVPPASRATPAYRRGAAGGVRGEPVEAGAGGNHRAAVLCGDHRMLRADDRLTRRARLTARPLENLQVIGTGTDDPGRRTVPERCLRNARRSAHRHREGASRVAASPPEPRPVILRVERSWRVEVDARANARIAHRHQAERGRLRRRLPLQRVVEDPGDEGAHAEALGSRPAANLPSEALVKRYGRSHDAENSRISSAHQAETGARRRSRRGIVSGSGPGSTMTGAKAVPRVSASPRGVDEFLDGMQNGDEIGTPRMPEGEFEAVRSRDRRPATGPARPPLTETASRFRRNVSARDLPVGAS